MSDLFIILIWLAVVAWTGFISFRTGREGGLIEGEWIGREKASAEWEKAIQSRGLVVLPDPTSSDETKSAP